MEWPRRSIDRQVDVEVDGDASRDDLVALVAHVDAIAEIPNSLRRGTEVRLVGRSLKGSA
jgi:putative redox protein